MQTLLLEDLVIERVETLRREAARERLAAGLGRRSLAGRVAGRSLHKLGFWLVGAGLRLAVAGGDRRVG